jgi:hypothetical protein
MTWRRRFSSTYPWRNRNAIPREKAMKIQVSLNTQAVDAADIRTQLDTELHGLERPGLRITTERREVEAGTLGIFEAYQFVLEYGPDIAARGIPLLTAVLQLANAILQRRGLKAKPKPKKTKKKARGASADTRSQSVAVVNVDGKNPIELPAEDARLKRYVNSISKLHGQSPSLTSARNAGSKKGKLRRGGQRTNDSTSTPSWQLCDVL